MSGFVEEFPFNVVVADECQRYIGETDGYSTLLAARACGVRILALSATPQLHAPQRLRELRKVFDEIKTFGVDDPGIREHIPERPLVVEQVETPPKLMRVYHALSELVRVYAFRIRKMYGPRHPRNCSKHPLCRAQLAVMMLRMRLVEDGASSVQGYGTWRFRDLRNRRKSLDADALLHLAKVGVTGGHVTVTAGPPQVGIPPEALHPVFDVGYLLELAEHEGFEVPLGVVLDGSSGAFGVEACPEGDMDRC